MKGTVERSDATLCPGVPSGCDLVDEPEYQLGPHSDSPLRTPSWSRRPYCSCLEEPRELVECYGKGGGQLEAHRNFLGVRLRRCSTVPKSERESRRSITATRREPDSGQKVRDDVVHKSSIHQGHRCMWSRACPGQQVNSATGSIPPARTMTAEAPRASSCHPERDHHKVEPGTLGSPDFANLTCLD